MFDFKIKILLTKYDLIILPITQAFCSLKARCSEGGSEVWVEITNANLVIDRVQPSDVQGYRLLCPCSCFGHADVWQGDNSASV